MEKFMIFKLDEEFAEFMPWKISDLPIVMDPKIKDEERQDYRQLKLTGDAMELHTLEQLMFGTPLPVDPFEGVFDTETKLEENIHEDDAGREVRSDEPGNEGAVNNS